MGVGIMESHAWEWESWRGGCGLVPVVEAVGLCVDGITVTGDVIAPSRHEIVCAYQQNHHTRGALRHFPILHPPQQIVGLVACSAPVLLATVIGSCVYVWGPRMGCRFRACERAHILKPSFSPLQ